MKFDKTEAKRLMKLLKNSIENKIELTHDLIKIVGVSKNHVEQISIEIEKPCEKIEVLYNVNFEQIYDTFKDTKTDINIEINLKTKAMRISNDNEKLDLSYEVGLTDNIYDTINLDYNSKTVFDVKSDDFYIFKRELSKIVKIYPYANMTIDKDKKNIIFDYNNMDKSRLIEDLKLQFKVVSTIEPNIKSYNDKGNTTILNVFELYDTLISKITKTDIEFTIGTMEGWTEITIAPITINLKQKNYKINYVIAPRVE